MQSRNQIKIESHEGFVQEFNNLLQKINTAISEIAQHERVNMEKANGSITERLNRLKYHRKKLKMMLTMYGKAAEEEWREVREDAQKIFSNARREFLQPTEELANA